MRKLLPVLLAVAALGAGSAFAQSNSGPMSRPSATPQGAAPGQSGTILSERDVREKLTAEGYTNVGSLKREGNIYSTDAMKNGSKVSLSIDARNGKIAPR
jgi:peptidase YpeB-like protein